MELKPGGEWQAAIFFLVHMSAVSVQQTAVTVAAAISACEKCVQWTMALAILATTTAQLDVISLLVWDFVFGVFEGALFWRIAARN